MLVGALRHALVSATGARVENRVIYIVINFGAIGIAALISLGFATAFYRAVGTSARVPRAKTAIIGLIAHAWLGCILAGALILAPPKGDVWTMTLGSAFIIWIGFVVPVLFATYAARGMAMKLAAIDSALWLNVMLIQAVVMRLIGLVAPPG